METISVLVGFLIGVVATAIAVELGLKKLFKPPAHNKITASWRLEEFDAPLVVALDAAEALYPRGSEVVTSGAANPQGFRDRAFRRNTNARANFVIDRNRERALLFLGPVQPGTLALHTVDPDLVARLKAEHRRLWETATAYVEELPLAEVVGKQGMAVRTRGTVQEVVPYRDRHLLRLTDGNHVLGVLVDAPLDLVGKDVVATGRLAKGTSGYTVLDADEVRLVRRERGGPSGERLVAVPVEGVRAARPAPGVAAAPAPEPPRPAERVLRIAPKTEAPAAPEPEPEMEFDTAEPLSSEAEKHKVRARVVLHR